MDTRNRSAHRAPAPPIEAAPAPPAQKIAPTPPAALALPLPVAESFLDAFGLMAGVFDRNGRPLAASRLHRICADFHHRCPATRDICLLHDPERARAALTSGGSWTEYQCPNGLAHGLTPIHINGKFAGSLIVGQFLLEAPDEATWRKRALAFGWDESAYLAAMREVPVLNRDRLDALMKLMSSYGAAIIERWESERAAAAAGEVIHAFARNRASAANETDALLHAVIDDLPGLVALKDDRGRYLMANRTLAELYGTSPSAMIGRLDSDLVADPQHLSQVLLDSLEVLAGGKTHVVDQPMVDQVTGETRHFRLTKRPFATADGHLRLLVVGQEITELLRAQIESRRAHHRLEFALEMTGDAVWEWDLASGRIVHNAQWGRVFDEYAERREHTRAEFLAMVHPEDRPRVERETAALACGQPYHSEHRIIGPSGRQRWVRVRGQISERGPDGLPQTVIGRATDITEERAAADAQRIAAVAFESQEGMIVTDRSGRILRVNQAFTELTGYSAEEAVGRTPALLRSGRHTTSFYQAMWEQLAASGRWQGELWNRRKDGKIYPEWITITAVRDDAGAVSHYVGAFLDITEQKEAQGRISALAFYDPLTGLPNRRLLVDRLAQASADHRRSLQHGALVFLDLDHFKTLNDTLGHDVGDQFLMLVAQRLRALVRERDTVARLGGDEFVVVLNQLGNTADQAATSAALVAQKLCTALGQPYALNGRSHYSSASLGVCLFPSGEDNADNLLKQADLALYKAKGGGRNQVRFYSPELQAAVDERARIETGLREALAERSFELFYQAQIDPAGRVVGAEALLRWRNESGELVMPGEFISIAEETGLIVPIGNQVIDAACAQIARWALKPLTAALSLSVNISERQTRQANFVETVQAAIHRHHIDPRRLKLELTESLVIADIDQIVAKMHALREIGVLFSLDDFGTGYSSLSALRKLPLEQIKIDQSFIHGLDDDEEDGVIVRAIVAMARSLQLRVLAEGVETETQFATLRKLGCDAYQGYLFGRPLAADAFETALNAGSNRAFQT